MSHYTKNTLRKPETRSINLQKHSKNAQGHLEINQVLYYQTGSHTHRTASPTSPKNKLQTFHINEKKMPIELKISPITKKCTTAKKL